MNIAYLIGNGFDLNLGLKTKYRQFYDYYLNKKDDNMTISNFKRELSKNIEKWADLEIELGKYASKFNKKNERNLIELLNDIQDALADYIDSQDIVFTISDTDHKSLVKDLLSPESHLSPREKDNYLKYKEKFNATNYNINVVLFNYTHTFERLFRWEEKPITISSRHYGGFNYSNTINSVEHIHGTTTSDMILGVNDISQIDNEELRNSLTTIRSLVKSEMNINAGTLRDNRCSSIISNADLICIFGMSLGQTDSIWWQKVIERLKTSNARVIIFTRYGELSPRRSYQAQDIKDDWARLLLSYGTLSDDEYEKLFKKIDVCLNSNMFKATIINEESSDVTNIGDLSLKLEDIIS